MAIGGNETTVVGAAIANTSTAKKLIFRTGDPFIAIPCNRLHRWKITSPRRNYGIVPSALYYPHACILKVRVALAFTGTGAPFKSVGLYRHFFTASTAAWWKNGCPEATFAS